MASYRDLKVFIVLACIAALAACGPPNEKARVRVTYEQVVNFQSYATEVGDTPTTAGDDGMFIMYRINKIENYGPEAKVFEFKTYKVTTIQDKASNKGLEHYEEHQLLPGTQADKTVVQPGQTLSNPDDLGCFIRRALTDDPKSLATFDALVDLVYQFDPDQPVSMLREPDDTDTAIISGGPALSLDPIVGLQTLCKG